LAVLRHFGYCHIPALHLWVFKMDPE